ncbi:MAG TPA: outer membrane protein assembly factor BamD, partial [Blastocatellia bacterium]|nr:outer membrane protein assembly factor BamD [Blastocatellia bacterium]
MRVAKILFAVLALALPFAACGGKAKNVLTLEEAKGPGRDRELFRQGIDAIRKGNFDEGRILLNTNINTYSDSPLIKMAKLAIADSYYLQGGSKGLAQAEVEYRDWIQFFPDDPLADETMLKIAEVHLKQVMAADRDTTHARLAERQLKDLLRRYPNTDSKEQVEQLMNQVQEILAMHELKVARFYFNIRESAQAAQLRTEEILNKYPNFSRFDEALYLHARAMEIQEDTETASRDLARIVSSHPHSEFAERAKETLKKWGKPVPDADPAKVAEGPADGKGLPSRLVGFMLGPHIDTSNKGVIIDRDLKTDEIVARAQEAGGVRIDGPVTPGATTTSNSPDARPRRAATQAGQDVEVKPGAPADPKSQSPSSKAKKSKNDKEKDKDKKKSDNSPKVLRNP